MLSLDESICNLPRGDVLIEDDRIVEVAPAIAADGAEVIDAGNMIVMPGLVDAHIHTWQTGIRGIAGDWTMGEYLRGMHANLATAFTPDDIYLANLVGALNQLNGGVTTMMDWCHNNPTPEHTDRAIDGLVDSGIRAVFGHGSAKPDPKEGQRHFSEIPHPRAEIERLRTGRLSSGEALVTLGMAILGPHYSTYEVTRHDLALAAEFDLLVSSHMSGGFNRMVPDGIFRLKDDGLLSPRFNVVHGNDLSDEEMDILTGHGVVFTVTPELEIQMGYGDPITGRVLARGGRPSIGVDVESSNSGDMFQVMRMALQIQRMVDNRPAASAHRNTEHLTVTSPQALEWATRNGAEMLGLGDRIGSLSPGRQADLILIRADDLNLVSANDPVQAVVFYANASNVDTVLVAGNPVKRDGRMLFPGLREKTGQLAASGKRILAQAGLAAATG